MKADDKIKIICFFGYKRKDIERKYESINKRVRLLGLGWTNNFEICLNIV